MCSAEIKPIQEIFLLSECMKLEEEKYKFNRTSPFTNKKSNKKYLEIAENKLIYESDIPIQNTSST